MIIKRIYAVTAATSILTLSAAGLASAQTVVTECGTTVSGDAVLGGDLDCTGFDGPAVILGNRATLDLGAFVLTGGNSDGVRCSRGRCSILGSGGEITQAGGCGISTDGRAVRIDVHDVTVSSSGGSGVCDAPKAGTNRQNARLILDNVVLQFNGHSGVNVKKLDVTNSVAEFNGRSGFRARRIRMSSSRSEGNGRWGVSGNWPGRIDVSDSTITGSGHDGIGNAKRVTLVDSEVSSNSMNGVAVRKLSASGSTLLDNGSNAICSVAGTVCTDVTVEKAPKLVGTTCGLSNKWRVPGETGPHGYPSKLRPWGVCALD